jgi:hypothetical protein
MLGFGLSREERVCRWPYRRGIFKKNSNFSEKVMLLGKKKF